MTVFLNIPYQKQNNKLLPPPNLTESEKQLVKELTCGSSTEANPQGEGYPDKSYRSAYVSLCKQKQTVGIVISSKNIGKPLTPGLI